MAQLGKDKVQIFGSQANATYPTNPDLSERELAWSQAIPGQMIIGNITDSGATYDTIGRRVTVAAQTPISNTAPLNEGEIAIDTTGPDVYVSTGVTSADWEQVNGAGTGDLLASNNLSDVSSTLAAIKNLIDGTAIAVKGTPVAGDKIIIQDSAAADILKYVAFSDFEPADATILKDADIGSTVQAWDADLDAVAANVTVTQAVDLDQIETRVNALDQSVILMDIWDASAGTFPGSGSAQAGESWIVSVAGTVDSVAFALNDRIIAITDNASTATYASNWHKADYTDEVQSVAGKTGAVTLAAADIESGTFADARIAASNVTQHLTLTGAIESTAGLETSLGSFTMAQLNAAISDGNVNDVDGGTWT